MPAPIVTEPPLTTYPVVFPTQAIETLEAAAARHIEAALGACFGRVDGPFGAAARLGIKPNTLRARMKRLGIEWRRFRPRK